MSVNEAWFHQKLDYLCRVWEVGPVGYVETPRGAIYIAEGWQARSPDIAGAAWTVMWAVKHRGTCVAQPMYVKTTATPDERKGAAVQSALEFLEKYHGQPLDRRALQKAS